MHHVGLASNEKIAEVFDSPAFSSYFGHDPIPEHEEGNMDKSTTGEPFAPLPVAEMELVEKTKKHYRVYKDAQHFVLIEAEMAYDAIKKSGIASPYKVDHVIYEANGIKQDSELKSHLNDAPATPPPIEASAPVEAPKEDVKPPSPETEPLTEDIPSP